MSEKYTEIFKLKEMLEEAGISFQFKDTSWVFPEENFTLKKYAIGYPVHDPMERVCSVVQGDYTYGSEQDLLEIMGLLTRSEAEQDTVAGWLTADNVFARISWHWNRTRGDE